MTLGAENSQITFLDGYDDILGGLTINATIPYALVFINLAREPWVVHMPEGEVRGNWELHGSTKPLAQASPKPKFEKKRSTIV